MHATLRDLSRSGEEVEFNLRVRARVILVSAAHGLCARLHLEMRDYMEGATNPRMVWVEADEIIEVQP